MKKKSTGYNQGSSMLLARVEAISLILALSSPFALGMDVVLSMTLRYKVGFSDSMMVFLFVMAMPFFYIVCFSFFVALGAMIRTLEPPTVVRDTVVVRTVNRGGKEVDRIIHVNDLHIEN